jgi:hypothetical protein
MPKNQRRHPALKRDLYARVRQVRPVALKLLAEGIDDWSEDIPCQEPQELSDAQIAQLSAWSEAVYAVGIAVGQFLRPEAFDKGGAR